MCLTSRGDRAFCSVECRRRQIFMDEQDAARGIISCFDFDISDDLSPEGRDIFLTLTSM
jgi:hypothetical protein